MANVSPPTPAEKDINIAWHDTFHPHFDTLVSVGYVDGCYPLSYGGSIEGLVIADGEVAFRESPQLGYGADLSADTVYICSTSASDTQDYLVQGLDATGAYATATVTATGTTAAAVSGTWNHIQRCICTTGADNVGLVYISTDATNVPTLITDQIQTVMAVGENYAINPMLQVPTGQLFTLNAFDFSQDVGQAAIIKIFARRQGRWIINFKFYVGNDDSFSQTFHTPLRLFEGDAMRVTITAGAGGAAASTFGMNGNVWDTTILDSRFAGIGTIFK